MNKYKSFTIVCMYIILTISITLPALAEKPSDENALKDISQAKVIWDITISDPKRLLRVMRVISTTYDDLVEQNVQPQMIFAFRGGVLRLLDNSEKERSSEDDQAHQELLLLINEISMRNGVVMESCSVAAHLMGIDNENIITEVVPVGNTFVSLIGYQQQGYALIPIY
ncbi:MAG: DsrE family protein [Pseudomonadota bacterium]